MRCTRYGEVETPATGNYYGKNGKWSMRNAKGFSLVELIVVMVIFSIVIIIISKAFENIVSQAGHQAKSATSQIEGVVGLEMLRTDISHAGYALPWTTDVTPTPGQVFNEVTVSPATGLVNATSLNEWYPTAVLGLTNPSGTVSAGSHYLVLKSALLALNTRAVGRWGFVNYSSGNNSSIRRINDPATDVRNGSMPAPDNVHDRVISILSGFTSTGGQVTQLLMNPSGDFFYTVPTNYVPTDPAFMPASASQTVFAYSISESELSAPYNRADYYISRTAANDPNFPMPATCNPGTGILFKAVAGHKGSAGGNYTGSNNEPLKYPLLNCVGDLQVVLVLTDSSGSTSLVSPDSPAYTLLSGLDKRDQLKEVKVFILAQEGKKDRNYGYPGTSVVVGEGGGGRTWSASDMAAAFGTDWKNYRWKVYSIDVQMKNLGGK